MTTVFKKLTVTIGAVIVGMMLSAAANAECGDLQRYKPGASLLPQSWEGSESGAASLLPVSTSTDPIVGFWHVTLTAKRNNPGPPDGTIIDNGFAQWHDDGTEILNSSRPPITGSFCLGVWKNVSPGRYILNHFPIGWDQNSNFVGIANLREEVTLSSGGNSFTGTFTLVQYDPSGNVLVRVIGVVSATRITVNTSASSLL